ncbi:DUF6088 family protein [Aliidiomarina haloalkalitolerans]|uniref:Transcriptional regulator, AbiEi antitoxin, Type IV TA system n=1 Tax=Aliidiomarina haloalkalitolerans TaxID=859059 RepID=A0A432VQX7_9GAMM|nr:DUF6088 family protein [Aliidiomarina haloalkalitolerans]RUO18639.1 hypothetical protein CWE06_10370 [Aliidiomarina haloalkalitolerans]
MSIAAQVEARIARMRKGTPFSIEGFYELGSEATVQKAFSRLAKSGEIVRVSKGFYVRPRSIESLPGVRVMPSPEEVAKVWARTHGYKLAEQGFEAAYRLGLQTQAPARTVYWTNGPSREFKVGNSIVEVKHVAASKLKWLNQPEGLILRGLSVMEPEQLKPEQFRKAFKRLSLNRIERERVLENLKHSTLSSQWRQKLTQIQSASM